jgi:hypothetical protein
VGLGTRRGRGSLRMALLAIGIAGASVTAGCLDPGHLIGQGGGSGSGGSSAGMTSTSAQSSSSGSGGAPLTASSGMGGIQVVSSYGGVVTTTGIGVAPMPGLWEKRILTHPTVVAVPWGDQVDSSVTSRLMGFFQTVLDSGYMDWLEEYYSVVASDGPIGRGAFGGLQPIKPANTGTSLNETDIGAELAGQINAGALHRLDIDTVYIVYLPSGVSVTGPACNGTSCKDWCACHTWTIEELGGSSTPIPFVIIPDMATDCAGMCDPISGTETPFQKASSAASRAMVETFTNPFGGSGWAPEIGEACAHQDTTITASDTTEYTVQTAWSLEANACIVTRPDCQRMSDTYGLDAQNQAFGFAPPDVVAWWTANGCSTAPSATSTSLCQKASEVYGIVSNQTFGYAPEAVQQWWGNCNTAPLTLKSLCQRASDVYGMIGGYSSGSAPGYVQDFWNKNNCGTSPIGQDACQKAADLYGIVHGVTWGFAPSDVQKWWTQNSCLTQASTNLAQQCQNFSDLYAVDNGTLGSAPSEVQKWWTDHGCSASPICQDISEIWGASANVTVGYAPLNVAAWWMNQGCTTQPLFTADTCQQAADTFGIVKNLTSGFAPSSVQLWWTNSHCNAYPRDNQRRSFANGPTP